MEKVIVFGLGKFFQRNEKKIKEKYEIVSFIDNNIKENETAKYYQQSIPINNPREAHGIKDYPIILMIKQFIKPFYQMLNLGVNEKHIIVGSFLFPETEGERILLDNGKLDIEKGKLVYNFITGKKFIIEDQREIDEISKKLLREKYKKDNTFIQLLANAPVEPVSRDFGGERGEPIDRHYIELFLKKNKNDIKGNVLEIGDNAYTLKYGLDNKVKSHILHVNGWGNTIKGNLETGEGLENRLFDTLIITQTLMFIFDLKSVTQNIYAIMKPNATALITVAGISQISRYDADNWGSFWGFHEEALKKLFIPLFGKENVEVHTYGNVKTAVAMLYGLCSEELSEEDFEVQDADYPVILSVRLHKGI